ncbi:MAG: FtsW/RodA/SpoVE family cell cycle protein [Lachnospiraceae bacterium]
MIWNNFSDISKYVMLIMMSFYTFGCFIVLAKRMSESSREFVFLSQDVFMLMLHLNGFLVLYDSTGDVRILIFYLAQLVFFLVVLTAFHNLYRGVSKLLINNMCMLLVIGFIILTRLSFYQAIRQFAFAVVGMTMTLIVPFLIKRVTFIRNLSWLYGIIGILILATVAALGNTSNGANISITIADITLQPAEFVKILFVFFVAGMYYHSIDFKQVVITTILAALHVMVLVLSRDLGGALILFVVYILMLYFVTAKLFYLAAGILSGALASVIAYRLFSHVQTRVIAWLDPISVIENEGYQIAQSLFAIGSGKWFGLGLYQGMPNKIPVVEQDFIYSAISEEMGALFGFCVILVCLSSLLMFLNISMQLTDGFYRLVALGLGIIYGFQIFLTIGGAIKLIPSTGVTLPLVSYGGSSLFSTMIIFAIIQGFYIIREDRQRVREEHRNEKKESGETNKTDRKKTGFDTDIQQL